MLTSQGSVRRQQSQLFGKRGLNVKNFYFQIKLLKRNEENSNEYPKAEGYLWKKASLGLGTQPFWGWLPPTEW